MVKIDRNRKNPPNVAPLPLDRARTVQGKSNSSFSDDLLEKEDRSCRERMEEILKEIDQLTSRLSGNLNLDDLMRYKRLVQKFLKEATERSYIVKRESSFTRRGARSVLVSVQRINQEIEDMMRDFLNKKKEPAEVLGTLDKIRGMLVDLLA